MLVGLPQTLNPIGILVGESTRVAFFRTHYSAAEKTSRQFLGKSEMLIGGRARL